jgi:prolipoprotein diacylglyceryltransferase
LPEGVLFHPTFLYESIWSLAGVALLLAADNRFKLRWGKVLGLYLVYYSIGRVWVEAIRIDPSEIILGLRINIWSAIFGILIGLAIIVIQSRRHTGLEATVYLPGKEPQTPVAAQSTDSGSNPEPAQDGPEQDSGNKLESEK